jgi:hypothetical protein
VNTHVRINFNLIKDDDGYPPVSVETLWVKVSRHSGEYIIDNIPFFVRVATIGDVVRAREEGAGLWFDSVVKRSSNSLIRVVFFNKEFLADVTACLCALGCVTEYSGDHNILGLSVPHSANLRHVQEYLQKRSMEGVLDFEEPILR